MVSGSWRLWPGPGRAQGGRPMPPHLWTLPAQPLQPPSAATMSSLSHDPLATNNRLLIA